MILSFSCANVRSIKDAAAFSLEANFDDTNRDTLIQYEDISVLRFSSIYGANGSGKTSFLQSLNLLQNLILSNRFVQPGVKLLRNPHKLALNEPTEYKICFVRNGIKYNYELQYDNSNIIKESLYFSPKGRTSKIFDRTDQILSFGADYVKLEPLCREKLFSNRLILSLAANETQIPEIQSVFSFFSTDLVIYGGNNSNWLNYSTDTIETRPEIKQKVLKFMNDIGINIVDIIAHIERIPVNPASIPKEVPDQLRSLMLADMRIVPHMKLVYKDFALDIQEESTGTRKLLNFICPLIDIFEGGKIFICDEIEKHLHPTIVRHLVELFMNNTKSDAQIIVTTHDIDLLDLDLLRRDQIWFTSINPAVRKTDLYSLASLKNVRKDENIKKNYLKGKYSLYQN